MKGLLPVKTEEMLTTFAQMCADAYDQISTPQYYKGEGPYLVALSTERKLCQFHIYEIVEADEFLANPQEETAALGDQEFFFAAAASLDLSQIQKAGSQIEFQVRKIIPDTPNCRLQVRKLFKTDPILAGSVFFMSENGALVHSKTLLHQKNTLN